MPSDNKNIHLDTDPGNNPGQGGDKKEVLNGDCDYRCRTDKRLRCSYVWKSDLTIKKRCIEYEDAKGVKKHICITSEVQAETGRYS